MKDKNVDIKDIQKELKGLGLYSGKLDGVNSDKTKEALKRFQRINPPLKVDGVAGKKTSALLFVEPFGARDSYTNERLVKIKTPLQSEVTDFYGPVGKNQTKITLPYTMKLAWDLDKKINRFSCHQKVVERLQKIFNDTKNHYGIDEIQRLGLDLFGGCLNVRKMRGGTKYSMHSWGIAVDIDPARNQLKWSHKRAQLAKPAYEAFWEIVESHGAVSLGRERDYDWMHFQFARL